jgi:vacuolar-type H+-ATPase subunit E/Vma4
LLEEHLEDRVEFSLICWGGLSARSVDGATRLVNTLESRIDRVLPYLKQQLLAWFGQDKTAVEGNPPLKIKNFA